MNPRDIGKKDREILDLVMSQVSIHKKWGEKHRCTCNMCSSHQKMGLTIQQIESLICEMKRLQEKHPKATVIFDIDTNRVEIRYPLPTDFHGFKIKLNPTLEVDEWYFYGPDANQG